MTSIGIVGLGKIARDQHVPAIASSSCFTLQATADPAAGLPSVRHYASIGEMLAGDAAPEAVAICTPPQVRPALALQALQQRRHVLLEKPPAPTVAALDDLRERAAAAGRTLFCAWHSRFAPAVVPARQWLASREVRRVSIEWREDVRDWHPGQTWIWRDGGFGVFDPGINALSIATELFAGLLLDDAVLRIPRNCAVPAVAELRLSSAGGADIRATFDFLRTGPPTWSIDVETDGGALRLWQGGGRLAIEGEEKPVGPHEEYTRLYERFATLIANGESDADAEPLAIVDAALAAGKRIATAPLDDSYGDLD